MQQVWWMLKIMEALVGSAAMYFHIKGFLQVDALPHNMFYCGTFFGFTLYAIFGCLSISIGGNVSVIMEAIVNGFGALLYFIASILSMANAENDFHLMYLSDFEEPEHPFFFYCKAQSISALACGALYLLHATFAIDVLVIPDDGTVSFDDDEEEDERTPMRPIKLYVFGKFIHEKLEHFAWFRHLGRKSKWRSPT